MFEGSDGASSGLETLTTAALSRWIPALERLADDVSDTERVDQIRLLEELKSAAAAAQARVTAGFVTSQRAAQAAAGMPAEDIGRGVAAQVALAKRESPARARRYVGWATILTTELPGTLAALERGSITEWRATLVARETGWLSVEHRREIDEDIAADLEGWGDRRVESEVRSRAYRLDPHGFMSRIRSAESDRRVTLRPAPDTMSLLTGLLPVAHLLMTDQTLFNTGAASGEPALVDGFGPVPAELARRLVVAAESPGGGVARWLRRLYADPSAGRLTAMDSRRRTFDDGLARFLVLRDQVCRTPWCDAPIRHLDHVTTAAEDGATDESNGQGLCEACNQAKTAAGWRARADAGGAGVSVETITPTGHRYRSAPPDPPRGRQVRRMDTVFADFVLSA